ncbi:MAG: band 7 protein [Candidatus Sungbacteria bacterium RIFCSPLOWO2_02_FULL_47_9]|uniref:Band 7 protein n=1 Tax=Candidatus Sungbacteria bacterium RIFCSPHIGHO2_01_FULL_47_32 TaxID=1802264 RepID=A0A1G2K4P1_9BACT|nr:MAG: Band 7 protein [Parcubacteria group bacterium GW2011_GWA2_47_10]OGZ93418.1 MAG: band 7 protein [Candidatus Sungbacteria bacterium RIFCSPHIGHO2_01_FULL_47_32]OGZ99831.1 MAG: band 7 protein [Candidatus Sungbacteria bacterium RIFCSPHIGHO2_02_FULL_46_12]OHA05048.1 MAG: band 7 protein [Candidatus Sungbacteria bacterium RIFCSPLOWO2_01_FULL_47_32]OHA10263.1 MAG: band 7 protein [Candidatus Sungbacteria bacterium RIFCSPLOWO2_02_FULL_47_9]
MTESLPIIIITVSFCIFFEQALLGLGKFFGFYTIIHERETRVYVLFGDIVGVLDQPGIHFLWPKLGWRALVVNWLGHAHTRSMSLDQKYLRSIPVNSEEGTPMGIGVWYEMFITDPVAHIFRNVDPEGSLTANVKNETIKNLSNLPLLEMLVNRHQMSRMVRQEVSAESAKWGYKLGSVYIRKVHFRDENMINQIEEKVVNQLRQVTSAIEQDGKNQVNVIASRAEQEASIEFAKAAAMRPQIVGTTLQKISQDPEILSTMFDILEYQRIIDGEGELVLVPDHARGDILTQLLAAENKGEPQTPKK